MKKLTGLISEYKFYIYFVAILTLNNLWDLEYFSVWIITLALLLTMPLAGVDYLLALILIFEDGILKAPRFYFEPESFVHYLYYLPTALALMTLINYAINRVSRERYELLSTIHRLKSERVDIESSVSDTLNRISHEEKEGLGLKGLLQQREDSFKNILDIIRKSYHPYSIFLYFYDANQDSFYLREHISESEQVKNKPIKSSEGILHAVTREKRPINVRRLRNSKYAIPFYNEKQEIQSVLAVPLLSGRRLKGVLCLDSLRTERFSTKEEEIIKGLAGEIVKVMDTSEAMLSFSKIKDELQNVCELGTRLNQNLTEERAVDILLDITKKFIDLDFSCFVSYNPESNKNSIVRINSSLEDKRFERRDFSCDDRLGLASWVIRNNVPLEYCQIKGKKKEIILFNRNFKLPFKYNSVLILPVSSYDRVLGTYIIASKRNNICRGEDRKLLESVCSQIGIALENARMYETLRTLATMDGLTGLKNHRVFQDTLSEELKRSQRTDEKFSLLLTDIDHFKTFNDNYGHPVGDYVLKEISTILLSCVRTIDLVARYGGEEFAIILINTDETGALKMAERIRKEVESDKFETAGKKLRVTLSLGVSTFPTSSDNKRELIDFADKALYWSKETGRNRATHFNSVRDRMVKLKILDEKSIKSTQATN